MGEVYWTPTRIDSANYCLFRYYIEYVLKKKPRGNSTLLAGTVLHSLIENFWDKLGSPDLIRINKKGKVTSEKKYSSAEQFADYSVGQWWRAVKFDEALREKISFLPECSEKRRLERRVIEWDPNFEEEKFVVANRIRQTAEKLFSFLVEEGPPDFKGEIGYSFNLDGINFRGFIDSLRIKDGQPLVVDYKTGLKPSIKEMKLKYDPQPTCYCLAVSGMATISSEFAKILHLESERETLLSGKMRISPLVQFEYWRITPEGVQRLRTHRTDAQYRELVAMIKGVSFDIENGIVYPERGRKCDYCRVKGTCDQISSNPFFCEKLCKAHQGTFSFIKAPLFLQGNNSQQENLPKQLTFRWEKNPEVGL